MDGIKLTGESEMPGEQPIQLPLSPQISLGLSWYRTQSSVVRGRRLTVRSMARPLMTEGTLHFHLMVRFVPRSKHIASRL
jgi:hypothetical protein